MPKNILKKFSRGLFWDINQAKTPTKNDFPFIVHRVLSYGTMDDTRNLIKIFGKQKVRAQFIKPARGIYQPAVLKLCQHILGVKKLNSRQYLKQIA